MTKGIIYLSSVGLSLTFYHESFLSSYWLIFNSTFESIGHNGYWLLNQPAWICVVQGQCESRSSTDGSVNHDAMWREQPSERYRQWVLQARPHRGIIWLCLLNKLLRQLPNLNLIQSVLITCLNTGKPSPHQVLECSHSWRQPEGVLLHLSTMYRNRLEVFS